MATLGEMVKGHREALLEASDTFKDDLEAYDREVDSHDHERVG